MLPVMVIALTMTPVPGGLTCVVALVMHEGYTLSRSRLNGGHPEPGNAELVEAGEASTEGHTSSWFKPGPGALGTTVPVLPVMMYPE